MSQIEAEQFANKAHNVVAMQVDDAVRMFADDADASWALLRIKSTLREGDVVDLNKFRAKKQAAQDALQRSKTPPPDDDETAEVTLQSLFDKLISTANWKRLKDKKNNANMESLWKNNSTGETITIVVPTVIFHSMRMNTPAIEIAVRYNNDLEIDGEEFYHNL
jgi:hypothetical protein